MQLLLDLVLKLVQISEFYILQMGDYNIDHPSLTVYS